MRRSLIWTLATIAALSAAALWSGDAPRVVAAIEPHLREHAQALEMPPLSAAQSQLTLPPLPTELAALTLEPAKRDVFVPVTAPVPPAPTVRASAPPPEPPPALPQAPPIQLRYLGTMLDPSGKRLVYLARGDAAVLVGVGDRLDEGYVVESFTADSVVLIDPPLNARATIPIPPAPQQ